MTGPHTENFRDILRTFRAAEAVRQLETGTSAELAKVFIEILTDPDTAARLGERAFQTFTSQTGAAARAREEIMALLSLESGVESLESEN
jgi:3-deoxy-D-manno-octulosonic-acid transferase